MKLKQEYGLDTYSMSDLVEEALKYYQENPQPILRENAVEESPIKEAQMEESQGNMEEDMNQDEPPNVDTAAAEAHKTVEPDGSKPALGTNPLFIKEKVVEDDTEVVESEESEIDEELHPSEDLRQCGKRIHECLFNGEEIPDQLYVDLYIAKLRLSYAYKDKSTLKGEVHAAGTRELELTRQIASLCDEIEQM